MSAAKSVIKTEANEMTRSGQNGFPTKRANLHIYNVANKRCWFLSRLIEFIRLAVRITQSECEEAYLLQG